MTEPLLKVEDLNGWYGGSHVLQSAALSIAEGESVALLGRNGAGKSTLMKCLLDAGPRVGGKVHFAGRNLTGMPPEKRARDGLVLVPEDRRIYSDITVEENILLGRHAAGSRQPMTLDRIWQLFPLLEPLRARQGYQLSGGQQQLVAVARGAISAPRLLVLDEPVEGLAPVVVQDMARDIKRLRETGMAMLISEQNLSFARACTDRLYLIDSGRIVFSGSWTAFDSDPGLKEKYLAV